MNWLESDSVESAVRMTFGERASSHAGPNGAAPEVFMYQRVRSAPGGGVLVRSNVPDATVQSSVPFSKLNVTEGTRPMEVSTFPTERVPATGAPSPSAVTVTSNVSVSPFSRPWALKAMVPTAAASGSPQPAAMLEAKVEGMGLVTVVSGWEVELAAVIRTFVRGTLPSL